MVFPILSYLPTPRKLLCRRFNHTVKEIATELLERTRVERQVNLKAEQAVEEKSIIGLLSELFDYSGDNCLILYVTHP